MAQNIPQKTPQELEPDICVIGAGAGGLMAASAAAAFGVSVVLIEKGRMGGETLYGGSLGASVDRCGRARQCGAERRPFWR